MFNLSKVIAIGSASIALVGVLATVWLARDLDRTKVDRDAWKQVAQTWQRAALDWERAFHRSEDLREKEDAQAVKAISDAAASCSRRVAQAKREAFSLSSLLNKEPKREPNGCPLRELLPADELRDAFDAPTG